MVRDPAGNYEAIDFRESAPESAYEDMFQGNVNGSIYGGLAAAVPSEVRGLEYAHKKYGVSAIPITMIEYLLNLQISGPSVEDGHERSHTCCERWIQRFEIQRRIQLLHLIILRLTHEQSQRIK